MYVVWTGFIGSGSVAGCCEQGNEPSGAIQSGELPDQLNDYYFLGLLHIELPTYKAE
jgi:hypothetical protein